MRCPEGTASHPRSFNELVVAVIFVWVPVVVLLAFLHEMLSLGHHHHGRVQATDASSTAQGKKPKKRIPRLSMITGHDVTAGGVVLTASELHDIDDIRGMMIDFAHDLEETLGTSTQTRTHRQTVVKTHLARLSMAADPAQEPLISSDESDAWTLRRARQQSALAQRRTRTSAVSQVRAPGTRKSTLGFFRPSKSTTEKTAAPGAGGLGRIAVPDSDQFEAEPEGGKHGAFAAIESAEMSLLGITKRQVPVRIEWHDLSFHIKKAKVLTKLSGHVIHGEMTALMGESGSGKSTVCRP